MTRRAIIAATVETIAATLDGLADKPGCENDLTSRTALLFAEHIRLLEPHIARMVEERLGVASYNLEQEGIQ